MSAEDLVVFKVLFDRPKDRRDIRELLFAQGGSFDSLYALETLRRVLAPRAGRLAAFEDLLARGHTP